MENIESLNTDEIKIDNKKKYYYKKYEKIECADCKGVYMRTNKLSHYKTQTHRMKSDIIKLTNSLNDIHKHVQISLKI